MWWDFKYCGIKIFGPLVQCFGGGGSGGGGGGSGAVSYPAYMQTVHNDWLDNTGVDTITDSVTDIMNAALGGSPWAAQAPYDPDADITAWEAVVAAFAAILAGITDTTSWAALFTQALTSVGAAPTLVIADETVADEAIADEAVVDEAVADMAGVTGITEAVIVADVDAFADQLDDEITTKVLPRFRRGMQDINAVISSAFPIGESIIEGFRDREVAKHNSAIRLAAAEKNADIDLEEGKANLSKDVEVARMNLSKDVSIAQMNLSKDVEVSRMNLSKDVDIAKANLSKDVSVGSVNSTAETEYDKMALEGSTQMLRLMLQRIAFHSEYMKTYIEAKRIKIVAKVEENSVDMKIDESDALWDLEVFQYGANLLAAIGGGTNPTQKPSLMQSAIGGALSGAAAGGMIAGASEGAIAGPVGIIAGGILGAASALL